MCRVKRVFGEYRNSKDPDQPTKPHNLIIKALVYIAIYSTVSKESVNEWWRPRSDCAHAQTDLGLRCPHMHEDTFTHDTGHMLKKP